MSFRNRRNNLFSLIVFIVMEVASLCILFSNMESRQILVGRVFTSLQGQIWGTIDSWNKYFSLKEQNERLAAENMELERLLHAADSTSPSVFTIRENFSYTPACIATMTLGSQHNYIILDKGSEDGVEVSDGVITRKGVLGIVEAVSSHFSYAISYNNTNMVISARVGREGAVGTLRWNGSSISSATLSDIPLHNSMEKGDTVYTSGFSPFFPGDIPLGTVIDKKIDGGSSCMADIEIFENFAALRHVVIVKNLDRDEIASLTVQDK